MEEANEDRIIERATKKLDTMPTRLQPNSSVNGPTKRNIKLNKKALTLNMMPIWVGETSCLSYHVENMTP